MENKSVFTFIKKYGLIVLLLALVLTGCSDLNKPIEENTTGFFNHYFIYNFSVLIKALADFMGGSYGLSIIIITLAIRLVLMPFMLKQTKSSLEMQDKMGIMKPELDAIQKKYKGKKRP
ncbi:YidC/Oxa1 family membrane protein insertase [Virgibacillus halophilus]|uniref:YidC/Oxa1 family membrane protein insertase n=1 Tax=Tigheibacillus halophilus TaxID=361280 RepID=A0ABU5CAI1_9BACI|nr:YidC/Oxa1 family membrane protein insertase [Virgibacillus halophilus]